MNFQQLTAMISAAIGVIGVVTDVSAAAPIIAKIQSLLGIANGLAAGLQPPTSLSADVNDLALGLIALKQSGLVSDTSLVDKAVGVLNQFEAAEADYMRGDLAIVDDNFSWNGKPGIACVMAKGGNAAQLHGM